MYERSTFLTDLDFLRVGGPQNERGSKTVISTDTIFEKSHRQIVIKNTKSGYQFFVIFGSPKNSEDPPNPEKKWYTLFRVVTFDFWGVTFDLSRVGTHEGVILDPSKWWGKKFFFHFFLVLK